MASNNIINNNLEIEDCIISIPKIKEQKYYQLTSAQKRLYFLQQMDLESTVYNMPYYLPLSIEADKQQVQETINLLIKRHESFRTSFHMKEDTPVQQIHEELSINIEEYKIKEDEKDELLEKFTRVFDLSSAPLLRIALVDVQDSGLYLLIDMHHIISDGTSIEVLEQEFFFLFSEKKLPELSLQYKDFSEWQNSEEQQEKRKEQEVFWINKFEGDLPVLDLPLDYVRPVMQSFEGATVSFVLSKEETDSIKSLAKENGLTIYMSVLSVFTLVLSKLSSHEDIIIGTTVAGRGHVDLEKIVGMFANTLAMRNEVQGNSTLKEYIGKLKQNTLESFEHQDYRFEDLVDKVSAERDVSRNPIFDVMFNMSNQGDFEGDLSTFNNDKLIHNSGISKFDLTLTAVDYGDQLMFSFEYCRNIFKPETIERYIGFFFNN